MIFGVRVSRLRRHDTIAITGKHTAADAQVISTRLNFPANRRRMTRLRLTGPVTSIVQGTELPDAFIIGNINLDIRTD